ncbi:MAG: BrnT family toxin [Steroidobacteraceae bacterium]
MATWDEQKRLVNIKAHGLDFAGGEAIWDDFTVTREDIRQRYTEQRLVVFGRLNRQVVVLVYTQRRRGPHFISLRKAEKYEARYYIAEAKKFQGKV